MTSNEILDSCKKLGFEYILYSVNQLNLVHDFNARLIYDRYRFGEIKTRENGQMIMHSHHWKPQDESFTSITQERFENILNDFIKKVKRWKECKKLNRIEEDF